MKNSYKIAAVIDIGSTVIRMKVGQMSGDQIKTLENLEYPLNLGRETFNHKKIRFSTMQAGSEIIRNYYKLAHELGVKNSCISLTATTALREAQNKEYVCDQIMVKTDHEVAILEDGQEKTYIFREMLRNILAYNKPNKYILMGYIGTGSVGIALCRDGEIIFSQNIRVGSLKLNEIIEELEEHRNISFLTALNEYIDALFDSISDRLKDYHVSDFYITGKEVDLIVSLCGSKSGDKKTVIKKEDINELYRDISMKSTIQVKQEHGLSTEHSEIILPSLALYKKMMTFNKNEHAIVLDISLCDAILFEYLKPGAFKDMCRTFDKSSVASAVYIAQRCSYDKAHAFTVKDYALKVFDNLKKIHGFTRRERLYLEIASILHDAGKFVNSSTHSVNSANLILDSYIIGISDEEMSVIANIARYHSNEVPSLEHSMYASLSTKNRIMVSKLSAIIRLADALDRSHTQKINNISMKLKKNRLEVMADCNKDLLLEEWTFEFKSRFFEEVFGIKCTLVNKA